jgi:hypothetical protein
VHVTSFPHQHLPTCRGWAKAVRCMLCQHMLCFCSLQRVFVLNLMGLHALMLMAFYGPPHNFDDWAVWSSLVPMVGVSASLSGTHICSHLQNYRLLD